MYDPGTLYTDPILTNLSVGYAEQNFFAGRLFPVTPVRTKSGKYRVYDRAHWLIHPDRREPLTVANEIVGRKWSEDVFSVKEHSLQTPIADEERQFYNSQGGLSQDAFGGGIDLDPEIDATELVTGSIMRGWEKKVADAVRNTANYGAGHTVTLAGAQQWDDYTNGVTSTSDPVANIITAINKIYTDTGRYPNVMAIPVLGLNIIARHPRVVDRFKNFTLTADNAFRELTGFEGTIIPVDSVYNAADNYEATEVITSLWGKDVFIGIVDPEPGQKTKTFGKTFAFPYPNGELRPVDRWREEPRKADLVRNSFNYDLKIVSNVAGYVIKTAFSASAF